MIYNPSTLSPYETLAFLPLQIKSSKLWLVTLVILCLTYLLAMIIELLTSPPAISPQSSLLSALYDSPVYLKGGPTLAQFSMTTSHLSSKPKSHKSLGLSWTTAASKGLRHASKPKMAALKPSPTIPAFVNLFGPTSMTPTESFIVFTALVLRFLLRNCLLQSRKWLFLGTSVLMMDACLMTQKSRRYETGPPAKISPMSVLFSAPRASCVSGSRTIPPLLVL